MAKRHFHLAFDDKYDAEVIEKLESEESTTGYVRRLVTLDICNALKKKDGSADKKPHSSIQDVSSSQ